MPKLSNFIRMKADPRAIKSLETMEMAKKAGFSTPKSNLTSKYFKDMKKYEKQYNSWKENDVPSNIEKAAKYNADRKEYLDYRSRYDEKFGKLLEENDRIEESAKDAIKNDKEMVLLRKKYNDDELIAERDATRKKLYDRMKEIKDEYNKKKHDIPTFAQWATAEGMNPELQWGPDTIDNLRESMVKAPNAPWFNHLDRLSNQEFITRYHTTDAKNIPSILEKGLLPKIGGGFMDNLPEGHPGRVRGVFTEVRSPEYRKGDSYFPSGGVGTVKLEINIPKEKYKSYDRYAFNPETQDKKSVKFQTSHGNMLNTVQTNGRTDIFKDKIDPEDINGIWVENSDGEYMRYTPYDFALDPEACANYIYGTGCIDAQYELKKLLGL